MGEMSAVAALVCSIISVRLMGVVERAQIVVVGSIGQQLQPDKIVAMAIGTHKLFAIRIGIAFFSWISSLMFSIEGMYSEKAVQKAAATMMKTVVVSNRARLVARHTRLVAMDVRKRMLSSKNT